MEIVVRTLCLLYWWTSLADKGEYAMRHAVSQPIFSAFHFGKAPKLSMRERGPNELPSRVGVYEFNLSALLSSAPPPPGISSILGPLSFCEKLFGDSSVP